MTSRYSDASSMYSHSEYTHDDHAPPVPTPAPEPAPMLAPSPRPPVPKRSSQRLSVRPPSGAPSPVRRQSTNSPDTPVSNQRASLLPMSGSATPEAVTPRSSTAFLSRPTFSFRPLSSVYPAQLAEPRKGFFGARDSSSGMPPMRQRPQAAFVLPPPSDTAFSSIRSGSVVDINDPDRYIGTVPDGHKAVARLDEGYSFDPDPGHWGAANIALNFPEPDDDLHNPDPKRDLKNDRHVAFSWRGFVNVGSLALLLLALLGLFAVYPMLSYFLRTPSSTLGGYNLGGINASGQVPDMLGNRGLVDPDTPKSAYTRTSFIDGQEYDLVFSDEFNVEGRSFYPGDDPYWEAVDMHYWSTNNLEWYDPSQVTTTGGSLKITLDSHKEHDMNYTGGMLSTWNKFCFTGGYIEANVSLPGSSKTYGLWPAVWTMGNLGRAGYGASLEGTWPYTYDSCDVGTLANQTDPRTGLPEAAHVGGVDSVKGEMSYLPGQRLSACTCSSESDGKDGQQMVHPGPRRSDGSFVGRSAPEIDIFEAQVDTNTLIGGVSQSAQWAPFNAAYVWDNSSANLIIADPTNSVLNTFVGNEYQQTTSVVTNTNQQCYTQGAGCFSTYGFEYSPGNDGYVQWVNDAKPVWEVRGAGMGPDDKTLIGQRPVPGEPMYILANLGMSHNFGPIDFKHLVFPAYMLVDYIRVYQPAHKRNIGCDPPDFPTADYINTYIEAYTNPNLTTWVDDYKQRMPKNRLIDQC
ncbi:glycoside hydrolase family 16 protein [Ceratobasidium sp. AG-Ba]|nr:glycoside hydrolase family 16 protein [Ceratobasidium sp. AG-Ba]